MATEVAAVLISAGLSTAVSGKAAESDLIGADLQAIQGFIERNLTDKTLSSAAIMRKFGLSRSGAQGMQEAQKNAEHRCPAEIVATGSPNQNL